MPLTRNTQHNLSPNDASNEPNNAQCEYEKISCSLTNDPHALVSVIIPVYNAASTLDTALDSIQTQTHCNLEIICINDGSTDNSLEIMCAHAATDDRIIIIDKKNQGYGATCNRGIDEARGKWIAIVEPDDWIEGEMYADMLEFASEFSEKIDIIKTPYWRIDHPATPQQRRFPCSYKLSVHPQKQPFTITDAIQLFHHHPSIWSAIYRKSFLDENGIRFKPIPGAGWADNPFLAETLCQARNIVYLDKAYYCYCEDTEEKTREFHQKNPDVPFDRWNEMLDIIERLNITDERILSAHYSRGFMYMSGVIEEHDPEQASIRDQLERMFERMDPDLVFSYPRISPGCRRLFAEVRGLPEPKINHLQYAGNLISEGIYNIRNVGLGETLRSTRDYLRDYRKRTGGR